MLNGLYQKKQVSICAAETLLRWQEVKFCKTFKIIKPGYLWE